MRGELSRTSAHAPLLRPALTGTTPPHPATPREAYRSRSFLLLFSLARPLLVAVSRPCLLWAAWVAVITASPSRRRFLSLPCPGLLPRQLILPLILAPACVSSCSSSSLFFSFFHSCDLDFIFGIWILLLCFLRVFLFGDFFFFFFFEFGVWRFLRREGLLCVVGV